MPHYMTQKVKKNNALITTQLPEQFSKNVVTHDSFET